MFKKSILAVATVAVALVAFQPTAQAHGLKVHVGGHGGHWGGHWGGGHWGGGHWGGGNWGGHWNHGHGHGGHGCFKVKKKFWSKKHHHFHTKFVKICK